jgi:hypothetical protein
MLVSIACKIRKMASLIERDNTPSETTIGGHAMVGQESKPIAHKPTEVGTHKGVVQEDKVQGTAAPERRRPRKQLNHKKKWNEDTSTDLMREYMQNYRAEGKDKEVSGLKSTYRKKFKVK